jgi:hypothetical protein
MKWPWSKKKFGGPVTPPLKLEVVKPNEPCDTPYTHEKTTALEPEPKPEPLRIGIDSNLFDTSFVLSTGTIQPYFLTVRSFMFPSFEPKCSYCGICGGFVGGRCKVCGAPAP